MARIYDNLETRFSEGLQGIISNVGVRRVDFCVGYFNLRGWNLIVNQVDELPGDYVYEDDDRRFRNKGVGSFRTQAERVCKKFSE